MPEIVVKLGSKVVDTHTLHQERIRIGRSHDNELVVDHLSVSRHHAEIRFDHGHWLIADLESANGTYVNGQRITTVPLYHADTITVGKLHLHFFDTPLDHQDETIHDNALDHTMILSPAMAKRACLTITRGRQRGKEFILAGDRTVIGRASDCDIRISDWTVSKYHAQILRHGDQFVIEDLGSWRAIQVNGLPVKESPLHDSDVIQLGGTRLTFRPVTGEMPAPQPEAPPKRASQIDTQSNDEGYKLAMETAAELAARGEISAPPPAQEVPVPSSSEEPGIDEAFAEGSNCAEADSSPAQLSEGEGGNGSLDTTDPEIAMWLRALKSDRPALRRHAARQLEKLTGQRHEC